MNYLAPHFWIILPLILLYSLLPDGKSLWRKVFLLCLSLGLYASWNPLSVIFIVWVGAVTYGSALILDRDGAGAGWRKSIFWLSVAGTALPLIFFKSRPLLPGGASLFFPIGLSFYTLQAVGYVSDVYHGRTKSVHSILDYSLFISFFPQLSSGPVSKADELLPQFSAPKRPLPCDLASGAKQIIWGIFLKSVVADNLGASVDAIYGNFLYYSGADCLLAAILYCFQLYADFCGYTLIALGLARGCGIILTDNFRQPFLAVSVSDFWRRWHITLGRWLKDYIYIPLGGSRCPRWRICFNLLVTFTVSGLWHGVAPTYVLWGVFLGLICSLEKILGLRRPGGRAALLLFRLMTFCAIAFSFILFRSPSLDFFAGFIRHIILAFGSITLPDIGGATVLIWAFGVGVVILRDLYKEYRGSDLKFSPALNTVVAALLVCAILSMGVLSGGNFIYVNF